MRKRKLIPHRDDGRRVFALSHVPLTFNAGDIDWHCPACDALIFGRTHEEQHYDVSIECHCCHSTIAMPAPGGALGERLRVVADNGTGAAMTIAASSPGENAHPA